MTFQKSNFSKNPAKFRHKKGHLDLDFRKSVGQKETAQRNIVVAFAENSREAPLPLRPKTSFYGTEIGVMLGQPQILS